MSASTPPTGIIRKAVKEGKQTESVSNKFKLSLIIVLDVPEILAMVRELAEYERELDSCKATEELLYKNLGFNGGPAYAHTVLVCEGERTVGMALYVPLLLPINRELIDPKWY